MRIYKLLCFVVLLLCFFLNACQSPIAPPIYKTSNEILNESLTLEEQNAYRTHINGISLPMWTWASEPVYLGFEEGIDGLSEVGIKGLPILMIESIKEETVKEAPTKEIADSYTAYGIKLAMDRAFAFTSVCRVKYFDLPDPNDAAVPSKHYYVRWTYAKNELPKIYNSEASAEEKSEAYRRFGIFAVPYVVKEIERGNREFEDFFILIGAHLSTPDYLKIVERTSLEQPPPKTEEINEALFKYAEDFDYKVWLSENEEDLDNLFKFLDAYCAEYEAEMAKG